MNKYWYILSIFILCSSATLGQENKVWLQPNRGQWDNRIIYRVDLAQGDFFVEKNQFTYALNNLGKVYHKAHEGEGEGDGTIKKIKHQTIHSHFVNSSWSGKVIEEDTSSFYRNYFLGSDSSQWRSKVRSYQKIKMIDFYPGIDLLLQTTPEAIKYSFIVHPGGDPSAIQIYNEGMQNMQVKEHQVILQTRFGPIKEYGLTAWNQLEGSKSDIQVKYSLNKDTISYNFPNGYDTTQTLIIDPFLSFSTFTGATSDNWGFTACPDKEGNLIAGGIIFGTGYPTSTGAYDVSYNGGYGKYKIDISIMKFSSDGSQMLYSTFLGGGGNETPNSIITDDQGNLYILGISTSADYPVTSNAYQKTNHGGTSTKQIEIRFDGSDIIVTKLNKFGTALLGSTFLGGTKNDGLNVSSLNYNYGDVFRGEIILDQSGDILIASSTKSSDFPIVNGSQATIGGKQDAVIAKFNSNLSNLIWSTYFGGSEDDAGYGLVISPSNDIYVTGGTKSNNLPFPKGHISSFQGGIADGYIAKLENATANLIGGTYIGTSEYDQSYFIQLDNSNKVYVFGQSLGNIPISPNVYNNPNSGQFIQQYSSDLTQLNWSTVVGGGNGVIEISPTAFLVSHCNKIYYTGWGGQVNQNHSQATGSTTYGFPTTSDAYQRQTNGSNFYIGVLSPDAKSLDYATFMGGTSSSYNHVDGGTSRFNKKGQIYHAVCGACGGNSYGFTTTPGVFSETNNSSNCNLAAWKFDLGTIHPTISIPNALICLPDSVYFANNSKNGNTYLWDFGDGSQSNQFDPIHYYSSPGYYKVQLIVSDDEGCFQADTTQLTIHIGEFHGGITQPTVKVCPGTPYTLEASGGNNYQWSPSQFLDDPTSATPVATIDSTTKFTVIVSDSCGVDTLSLILETYVPKIRTSENQPVCKGDTTQLWASGGVNYNWSSKSPKSFVGNTSSDTINVSPLKDATYQVEVATANGCTITKKIHLTVIPHRPYPQLTDTALYCHGESIHIIATGADSITWSPTSFINTTKGHLVRVSSPTNQWYYVDFTNVCGTVTDSVFVRVITVDAQAGNDTIVCPNEPINLWAKGGIHYRWEPTSFIAFPADSITYAIPQNPITYTVYVTDKYGCKGSAQVNVQHFSTPYVGVSPDYYGFPGDRVQLSASGSGEGNYFWSPTEFLSCVNCYNPIATPNKSITYTVTFIDSNGCENTNEVNILFEALIYVPNTFTPNKDGDNDRFLIKGGNIKQFSLTIFNRWGEIVFKSNSIHKSWDGTYGGMNSPDGTYVWKIRYTGLENKRKELVGHVNLLR